MEAAVEQRKREIVRASWISIAGNALLSIIKIAGGWVSGSLAVVGDGIDSATDIVTSLITLLTARIISRPPDVNYPYGYEKADAVAAKALSFFIFFAGAQLGVSTIGKLGADEGMKLPTTLAIYITLVSIVVKLALTVHQQRVGKRVNSYMLQANARNMRNDVLTSTVVLIGLFFTTILKMPLIDSIIALAVSVWIMKIAFGIFMETTTDLMDGIKNPGIYKKIFEAIESVDGASNPHRMRMRKVGSMYMMELDIEVDGFATVYQSHAIAHLVEEKLRQTIDNLYDVVIHVEPAGDDPEDERFGISRKNIL